MSPRRFPLLGELERRRVGRVAIGYAVAAWVLIQVADLVVPRLGLPEWLVTLFIVIAIAGFPVALILSWFFDVVPADAVSGPVPRWLAAGIIAAVVLAVGAATVRVWPRIMGGPPQIRSVAVLPFVNLSSDPEQAYFADGMHDALITELANIASVRVVSRTSTLRFRETDRPMSEVARELGVDAVVEGTVLRVGDRIRMQAQLISPFPRERHLWAEGFEGGVREVSMTHGEIARDIARAIEATVTPAEANRLADRRSVDPAAYEKYLRGMYFLRQQTPEGFERGLRELHDAVAMDPADPDAYAGLAIGYSLIGHATIPDAFERAKAAASRALTLDSTTVAAHEALGEIALYRDWDFAEAERRFRRVMALSPNVADAAAHYAWRLEIDARTDDALSSMARARQLDPLNPIWASWSGWIALDTDNEAALADGRSALELDPRHPHALYVTARAAAELGRVDEALPLVERLMEIAPFRWGAAHVHAVLGDTAAALALLPAVEASPSPMNAFGAALVYAELGRADRAMDWLEEARRLRFSWMPWVHRPSVFRPLDGDPRFESLRREVGLPGGAVAAGARG